MNIKIIIYKKGESIENCLGMLKKTLENAGQQVIVEEINPALKLKEYEYAKLEKIELLNTDYSVKDFDLIIFGAPVWSFSSPVLAEYLQKMENAEGKKFAIFIVCIMPANVMRKLSSIVATRGGDVISTLTVQSLFEIKGNKTLVMKKFAEDLLEKLEPKPKKKFKLKIELKNIRLRVKADPNMPKTSGFVGIKIPKVPAFSNIKLPKVPNLDNLKLPKVPNIPNIKFPKAARIKLPEFKFGKPKKKENGKLQVNGKAEKLPEKSDAGAEMQKSG
ncbi:MAG: hypothetical protein AABW72_00910 [archaeon]